MRGRGKSGTSGHPGRAEYDRPRAGRLVLGLLSDLPRKNTIAEWAGEAGPHGMQHLLCRASWEADAVRDDVREYVVAHLHDEEAVLVVDETGDAKKGAHTVGVQRQYTGTAGRIENSQLAVYLIHAGERGHAAVDRELDIPRSWAGDPNRCRAEAPVSAGEVRTGRVPKRGGSSMPTASPRLTRRGRAAP
nr:transposase [Streptomyces spiramenti]